MQTLSFKHPHFSSDFKKVAGIGDGIEQWIQISSNPNSQCQTYSTCKSHKTVKRLFICTQNGSISYLLDAYAGSLTYRFVTEDANSSLIYIRLLYFI